MPVVLIGGVVLATIAIVLGARFIGREIGTSIGSRFSKQLLFDKAMPERWRDRELCDKVDHSVLAHFRRIDADRREGGQRAALATLPRGMQLVYLLYGLDGEVVNGGFEQFFSNSTGELAEETLAACEFIGAERRAELLRQAIAVWKPYETRLRAAGENKAAKQEADRLFYAEIRPKLHELSRAFWAINQETEPLVGLLAGYLRQHPDECEIGENR